MSLDENDSRDVSTRQDTTSEFSFDELTRGLADGSLSRRRALRLFGVALVGSVLASIPGVAVAKPPAGTCLKVDKPCKTNTDCCSQNCETRNGKLVCGPAVQCTGSGQGNCPQPASECLQILCSASGFCGAPQAKPNNTPCDLDNNPCTEDTCQAGVCTTGGVKTCPGSTNPCARNVCNPATGNCELEAANAGAECRPAQGDCDLPALCTGTALGCPDNPLKEAGTICREAAGTCDVAEVCTGTSNQCPNNEFLPAGPCVTSNPDNLCLVGTCSGTSGTCQETTRSCPENQVCTPATGCGCPTTAPNLCNNDRCISCAEGRVFNAATCSCDCPATAPLCNGQCVSRTCSVTGQTFNPETCRCECPATAPLCGGQCVSTTCTGPRVFNQATCRCVCPATNPRDCGDAGCCTGSNCSPARRGICITA